MPFVACLIAAALTLLPIATVLTILPAPPSRHAEIDGADGGSMREWDGNPPIIHTRVPEDKPDGEPLPDEKPEPEPGSAIDSAAFAERLDREAQCDSIERELELRRPVQRDFHRCPGTARWRFEDLRIAVVGQPWTQDDSGIEITVTIERPGAPALVSRYPTWVLSGIWLQVGYLDRAGTRYVLLQDFSGGLSCCMNARLLIADGPHRRMVPLGANVGFPLLEPYPTDVDGDGHTDFVLQDERFYNRFAAPAPRTPPRIWNLRNGRLVDVSAERAFRGLFFHAAREVRSYCLAPDGTGLLTACPTYLASAARSGQFDHAWRETMEVCASAQVPARRDDFASELQSFLRDAGYLAEAPERSPRNPCDQPAPT